MISTHDTVRFLKNIYFVFKKFAFFILYSAKSPRLSTTSNIRFGTDNKNMKILFDQSLPTLTQSIQISIQALTVH